MVLVMGDREVLDTAAELGLDPIAALAAAWDGHAILGWSTAGQAIGGRVHDGALVVTVLRFETTTVLSARAALRTAGSARRAGREVAEALADPSLRVVFLAADGLQFNGSAIAAGITDVLPDVEVVGALAGDGVRYEQAWTVVEGAAVEGRLCAVGLYGDDIEVAHGSGADWRPVGPERLVTNTHGNVIHELDGQTATDLYHDYLGTLSDELLANSSMLSMEVRDLDGDVSLRTPRRFHPDGSVTMSGDVAQGATARLVRSSPHELVHDASIAAKTARLEDAAVCLVVSTVGRRRVLGQRVEDELDAVIAALPEHTPVVGCWAYGAIVPTDHGADMVDQAICITTLAERASTDASSTTPPPFVPTGTDRAIPSETQEG